jgi:MtN3 and saliva related transmembrane protein
MESGIGIVAGACTTFSILPQIISNYKRKSCDGLSWGLILVNLVGVSLWTLYGGLLHNPVIITYNAISTTGMLTLTFMKYRYQTTQSQPGEQMPILKEISIG